jgi:hypothetical protein
VFGGLFESPQQKELARAQGEVKRAREFPKIWREKLLREGDTSITGYGEGVGTVAGDIRSRFKRQGGFLEIFSLYNVLGNDLIGLERDLEQTAIECTKKARKADSEVVQIEFLKLGFGSLLFFHNAQVKRLYLTGPDAVRADAWDVHQKLSTMADALAEASVQAMSPDEAMGENW